MSKSKSSAKGARFVLFRLTLSMGGEWKRGYLGEDGVWTPVRSRARVGTLANMKALLDKLKREYPDLILEKVPN